MRRKKIGVFIMAWLCACFIGAAFSACGDEEHTHSYTSQTTEATCTENGLITYACSCGDSYTEEIPALGHDEKAHAAKAETCTEIGWEEYVTCEREGCDYTTYEEISATGKHIWDDGEETTAPTCTKEGEMTYTCTVCKTATKTEPIEKLPHEHGTEWESNATHHWHECTCSDKTDEAGHTPSAPATATTPQICIICNYVIQEATGILFNTLAVDGTKVYGKVSNATTEFSFINEVKVNGNATYVVDDNKDCGSPIYSKTVDLKIGDNTFYVLEMIGNDIKLYTVTVRRRPTYEVTFNANGGTAVEKQTIEEDSLATESETTRTGYTFAGWDYDFTQPITDDTEITANWSANTDTKYTVNYYLQNLENYEYSLQESVELKGETDTTATAEIKEYTHFTYYASKSTVSGNIHGDGSLVLNIYYTRNSYDIVSNVNNTKAGTTTSVNNTYKYNKQITLTATTNAGYTWLGWYDGETLACKTEEFTFSVVKPVTYTAKWFTHTDTKYTVNYYLQNIENDEYTLDHTDSLSGTTDTTATAKIKTFENFIYNESASTISGNINGDGSRTLSVCYVRNLYTLSVNNSSLGSITNNGQHKYGKEISSTATPFLGCDFIGWYNGETLLSSDSTYTFTANQDVTAKFVMKAEMANYNFNSTLDTCAITDIKDKTVTEIILPDYVTSIGDSAFYNCNSLTSIEIPDSVSYIGDYAFYNCDSLTSVEIPDGVTIIGSGAFYGCNGLTSIEIPDGVTIIGSSAFSGCNSLISAVISDSLTTMGEDVFYGCSSLQEITLPFAGSSKSGNSKTHLGYIFGANSYTLNNNYVPASLKKVTITSATSIGEDAFNGCSNLTSVEIGNSVTSIGDSAFAFCDRLTSVVIGDSVKNIGKSAFYECNSLTSVVIPQSVTSIGEKAFYNCNNLTNVDIPNRIRVINDYAFYNCSSLTDVVIPDSATSIGYAAFFGCSNLANLVVGNGITVIIDSAFNGCSNLTSVEIGNKVTTIGAYAFYNCSSLTSLVIPDSVTSINYGAFYGCSSLTSAVISDSLTTIGEDVFYGCSSLQEITLPFAGSSKSGNSKTHLGYIFGANSYTLNNNYVPASLKKVTITSATSIGQYAFNGCSNLTSVEIGNKVTTIGAYAFYNCSSLTSVVIPENLTTIANLAFSNCSSLTSVVIPESVICIGYNAFSSCSGLTSVYYKGTASEWAGISIDSSNTELTTANRYHYSESEPALNAEGTAYDGNYWYYDENKQPVVWVYVKPEE